MPEYTFRPIEHWPREWTRDRRDGQFKAKYDATLTDLIYELDKLDATTVVIQLALNDSDIRRDGMPRAGSRPRHPGVIVSYEIKSGPKKGTYSLPSDAYYDWQHNLRAIALTLEALRAVDRYGVTVCGEQYRGWLALPEPQSDLSSTEAAAEFVLKSAGVSVGMTCDLLASPEMFQHWYKLAAKALHPDGGGDLNQFVLLSRAKDVIERHQSGK